MSHNLSVGDLTFFVSAAGMPGLQRAELGVHFGYLSWIIRNPFIYVLIYLFSV